MLPDDSRIAGVVRLGEEAVPLTIDPDQRGARASGLRRRAVGLCGVPLAAIALTLLTSCGTAGTAAAPTVPAAVTSLAIATSVPSVLAATPARASTPSTDATPGATPAAIVPTAPVPPPTIPAAPVSTLAPPAAAAAPSPPTATIARPAAAESPVAAEQNPLGDIPDSQVFVSYRSAEGVYQLDVPEGWARSGQSADVQFIDKLDGLRVTITSATTPPTAASARNQQVAALERAGRAVQVRTLKDAKLPGGPAVIVDYTSNSDPSPVTGKQVRLENNAYLFFKAGKLATVTLSAPFGADNVDQWQRIGSSFRWM